MTLDIGSVVADRFVVEGVAGSGGMGAVFRAHDRQGATTVALKLCHVNESAQVSRFSREVRVLAALRHPHIVGYVSDGHTPDGRPFLAMEWLDGEDLARRLRRAPLRLEESLQIVEQVTAALVAAHEAGVVHRDLKPSNVFLRGGRSDDVVLLDFGIASLGPLRSSLTQTGALVGTPEYMSPEQARAEREVGAAADIFSLGSLLFECVTGRSPFSADRLMAVLAKIVFEDAPRLSTAWSAAPPELDDLLGRMLAKAAAARPTARALGLELAALRATPIATHPPVRRGPVLQGPEHQILSVVLAAPARPSPSELPIEHLDTLRVTFSHGDGRVEALADGSIAIAFGQTGRAAATDRAAQAARCALLLKEQLPHARIAIATGRGVLAGAPAGSALERAAELLETTMPESPPETGIWIDEVTAGLVEASFALREANGRRLLIGEQTSVDPSRPLLGKPTPCVGRELDLSALQATLATVIEESSARVVVIRAAPGMGKSRLRHEFVRRAATQHSEIVTLIGRCDPMGAGSSYGLLAQMIRTLTGTPETATPAELRQALLQWARTHVPTDALLLAAFLGELCEAPFPDDDLPLVRAARQDATLMAEQVTRAFVTCLRAECSHRPLLVILEDLRWGDRPTVRVISAALRSLRDLPLCVLALARPEIDDVFPRLWDEHGPTNLSLRPLNRRACERLCRDVLGPAIPAEAIDRIIEQSGGNALFLEELIRAVADGKGDALPESVLAMLQARLMRLMPNARRVLRAASIFGETFDKGGVRALLGEAAHDDIEPWLVSLVEAELLEIERSNVLPTELTYRFRHALMRDAAYSMLAEADRIAGHLAAGRFLESTGECDPMVLARHFEVGGDATRAGECYARAAEQAHLRGDSSAVIARAELAVAQAVPKETRARLLALIAEELGWQLDFERAASVAEEVLRVSAPGSVEWATAIAPRIFYVLLRSDHAAVADLNHQLGAVAPEAAALQKVTFAIFAARFWNYLDGDPEASTELLERQRELVTPTLGEEPLVLAWHCLTQAYYEIVGHAGPSSALAYARRCQDAFRSIQHQRGDLLARTAIGKCLWMLGRYAEAERALESTIIPGLAFGPIDIDRVSCLLEVWLAQGRLTEARAFAEASLATTAQRNEIETIFEGITRATYATVLCQLGETGRAEEEARRACELSSLATGVRLWADTSLARVLLERGKPAEALDLATRATGLHVARKFHGPSHALAHLLRSDALVALGDHEAARAARLAARAVVDERAGRIEVVELRKSYLQVASHTRILDLTSE